jgi:hypothetical protein
LAPGCHQIIHVEDMQGQAVADAQVSTQMSEDYGGGPGPSATTNRFGDAMLKRTSYNNPPLWITVYKPGYRRRGVTYIPDNRVVIQIQRIIPE